MKIEFAFAKALRRLRKAKNMTQEDFGEVSGRTYLSSLERGLKSPTLNKIEELAAAMGIQPLTLLLATYAERTPDKPLVEIIADSMRELEAFSSPPEEK
ncbi:Helix-turn-helix [Andreprevotia lacus DSM 23236]|jgi:transcriptional regulator with XRE-family HTH domain|uniref:Helix-turn-helix n=1 Tax=Andreprevotia lacus DSM 23236 TaxID=1121001 RepID=A0A1W1XZP5_9NEIS|nr:helix-turn-helix transcriptional regulator [Andreprevotia lacus]SMC29383.1 Helix-turn-helix [Andreprevotia lacus DSM 23236]